MTTKKYLVSVNGEEADWLEMHPEVSKSGLFQKVVSYMRITGRTILLDEDIETMMERQRNAKREAS